MDQPLSPIRHIFHPTDLSQASASAFHHALAVALAARAKLTIMHVAGGDRIHRNELPGVRETLVRWGAIRSVDDAPGLAELGLSVRKVISQEQDPVQACVDHLSRHPADLVVLSTGQHEGRMRWLERSISEEIRRATLAMTLFLPHGVSGWVDANTGGIELSRIAVTTRNGRDALEPWYRLSDLLSVFPANRTTADLLHVAEGDSPPDITPLAVDLKVVEGPVVPTIVAQATGYQLVVMGTEGPQGLFDALRGTTTEQVLRHARCSLLAVPLARQVGA